MAKNKGVGRMVTYVTHERKTEGETITVAACDRVGSKHPGEKCFFPKGHTGKHSWGKPEGIWAISGIGEMYITSGFKYDKMWFAMAHDDGADYTNGWVILGCGMTPEELVASVADTVATGEALPDQSLLDFLAAFKAWLVSDKSHLGGNDAARYQFKHYLWHEDCDEEQVPMLNVVVQCMPNYGT